MLDAIGAPLSALKDYAERCDGGLVALAFVGDGHERPFGRADAELAHHLANLPLADRLPLALVAGDLRGADLALALSCSCVALRREAVLATGFGRPGSAAVYVAAARRIGGPACERLLFGPLPLSAEGADGAHLAWSVAQEADAVARAGTRASTLLSVARANLVTWPVLLAAQRALMDGPVSADELQS